MTYDTELILYEGDRVKHWSGATGVVTRISFEDFYTYLGTEEGDRHTVRVVTVQPDMTPRQRKPYPPARWDGITEVK